MAKKKRPEPQRPTGPTYPMVFETFRRLGFWEQNQIHAKEPSCFNGCVNIKKYRVTFEEIEEPIEVLQHRLQELWDNLETNYHHTEPMRAKARELGFELVGSMGNKRKAKP